MEKNEIKFLKPHLDHTFGCFGTGPGLLPNPQRFVCLLPARLSCCKWSWRRWGGSLSLRHSFPIRLVANIGRYWSQMLFKTHPACWVHNYDIQPHRALPLVISVTSWPARSSSSLKKVVSPGLVSPSKLLPSAWSLQNMCTCLLVLHLP